MRSLLGIGLALLFCTSAYAQDAKQAAVHRLVEAMRFDEGYSDSVRLCKMQADRGQSPRAAYAENPGQFHGLSPSSAYWPEMERLYERYASDFCNIVKPQGTKDIYLQIFANRLSLAELEAAAAFAATPAGRAMQAAAREAGRTSAAFQVEEQNRNTAAAGARFQAGFQEIIGRFKSAPR